MLDSSLNIQIQSVDGQGNCGISLSYVFCPFALVKSCLDCLSELLQRWAPARFVENVIENVLFALPSDSKHECLVLLEGRSGPAKGKPLAIDLQRERNYGCRL